LLGNARDALFELSDAVIQMRQIQSFAELSCAPVFRRQWPSVYEALQDGRPDPEALLRLYLGQLPTDQRLILAGDHTAWVRLWAESLSGRAYQHQPTPIPGRRPITIGHGYSSLVVIPERHTSWALTLLHERIQDQKPVNSGAQQLRRVCQTLSVRPLSLWDSEYGCPTFLKETADVQADKLFRLRTNLCLEGATKPYSGRGRRPTHGVKFNFKDPATWWEPDQKIEGEDPEFGGVQVWIWRVLRFRQALDCPMIVARIERTQAPGTRRKPKILWLGWVGDAPPEGWWGQYAQRYPIDHWYRFAKGRLHWTLPMLATPAQGERWSALMPLITWQLWLARSWVSDKPLPWQKPQEKLSPGRTCQGLSAILARIGTPAQAPKPRGKAPGWPKGRERKKRARYELVRSAQWQRIRARKKAKVASQTA